MLELGNPGTSRLTLGACTLARIACFGLLILVERFARKLPRPHLDCSMAAPPWTFCPFPPLATSTWFLKYQDAISPLCLGRRTQAAGGRSAYQDTQAMMPLVGDDPLVCITFWLSTSQCPKACYEATITRRQAPSKCKVQFCSVAVQLPVFLPDALYAWRRFAVDTAFWGFLLGPSNRISALGIVESHFDQS